jgi:hypothetical protein
MSVYELSVKQSNNIIQEKIKKLQSEIRPVENPIIQKILPFLPYDINKNILDKLNIQKKIYLLEKKFYILLEIFIHNRFTYYTSDNDYYYTLSYDRISGNEQYTIIRGHQCLNSTLKKNIEDRIGISGFYYPTDLYYRKLDYFRNKEIVDIYNSTDNYDLKNCLDILSKKWEKMQDKLDELYHKLLSLEAINYERSNKIITFNGIIKKDYKIFKSNSSINRKPMDLFLKDVSDIVNIYKNKIDYIICKD